MNLSHTDSTKQAEVQKLRRLVNRFGWQHAAVKAQVAKLRAMEAAAGSK